MATGFDAVRQARVRSVGAAFLRRRPLIVAPAIALMLAVLWRSGFSGVRLAAVACVTGTMLAFFTIEAQLMRRMALSPRWLLVSLVITAAGISAGCALTGTWQSPILPLLFAPVVIAFAAFGRGRTSAGMLAYLVVLLGGLALLSRVDPWPPVAMPYRGVLTCAATVVSLLLLEVGVGSLTSAYADTAAQLDRMRTAVVEESRLRARDLEAVGAKVAHDVKNPLASIKGLVQLAQRNPSHDKNGRRLKVVLGEVARIEQTLADYLSMSRPIDDLELADTDVGRVLRDVAAAQEARARERGVQLEVRAPSLHAVVDDRRLRDALLNLSSNAIESTGAGGTVALALRAHDEVLRIEVRDTGRGMTPDELERVGTPFYTTRAGGTGLGVALARTAIVQHGGSLSYESEPERGTRAVVQLPLAGGGAA